MIVPLILSSGGLRVNAIIFGGTGMVGQGVLRECLLDPDVLHVLSVVRSPSGQQHPKFRELVHANFFDFSPIESEISGFDAALFCLGATSAGRPNSNTPSCHSTHARRQVENGSLSHSLFDPAAAGSLAAREVPTVRHDDGAAWPRDARRRQARRVEDRARERGYQQTLTDAPPAPRIHDTLPSIHDSVVQFITGQRRKQVFGVFW